MSDWMGRAFATAVDRHDTRCAKGDICRNRAWHIDNDYLRVAVAEEASLLADELAQANAWLAGRR